MKTLSLVALTALLLVTIAFFAFDSSSSSDGLLRSVRRNLQLAVVGNNGSPSHVFPLGECLGDCDTDEDCEGDLICFQRDEGEPVPGCYGQYESNWDYCVQPEVYSSTSAPVSTPAASTSLVVVGDNGSPSSAFPLGKCQGDCDSDSDCAPGLICFQRSGNDPVPGCLGNDNTPADYCYDPNDSLSTIPPKEQIGSTSESFGLKIYWEEGYEWQDETFERKWCLRCDSTRPECSPGRRVYITDCDTDMITDWQFLYLPNGAFFIKMVAADLCLTVPENTQDRFTVEYCDSNNERQVFMTSGDAVWGGKFEIHPIWAAGGCVGNTHHPKYGESLYLWRCEVSRGSDTSQWNFY